MSPSSRALSRCILLALVGLGACNRGKGTTPPGTTPTVVVDDAVTERAAILAASDLPSTHDTPLPNDPMAVTIHRLSNGMTVYFSVDRQAPRFTGWIAVRSGSRHDPPNSTGLAHYLEHMLFKGTDDLGVTDAKAEATHVAKIAELYASLRSTKDAAARKTIFAQIDAETQAMAKFAIPNEFDRVMSLMGTEDVNAYTSDDETVYLANVPANRLAAWAEVERERFSDPVFRLFYTELEAVYEEKNLSLDSPEERVWETMTRALMPNHPYGNQTTIGTSEHLKTPAYADMAEYFERWYVPNNMAIVLAGDIDPKTALPILERTLGQLEPKLLPEPHAGKVSPLSGRTKHEVFAEGEEAVTVAWLGVPESHADEPALAVMDRMLDDAKVGLLNTELELTQKLLDAGSFQVLNREAGYIGIRGTALEGQTPEEVEALLLGVVEKLRDGAFTDADVEAAKLHRTVDRKLQLEFPIARASVMTGAFAGHREWSDLLAREAAFEKVTRDDVIRVAKKYLGPDLVVVARREGKPDIPKIDKPEITPVPIDPTRTSAFAKRVIAMPAPQLEPQWAVEGTHYVRTKLPAGDMLSSKNTRNDLFSVTYVAERGFRKEPLLCYALDLLELSGSGELDADAFQKQVYAKGASIETACDAEHSWVTVSGPDAQMDAVLALMDGWFASPRFDPETLARLHENTLSERSDGMQEDWRLVAALDDFAKHDQRSAWLQTPSNKALGKARPKALRSLIGSFFGVEHRTHYYGPRDAAAVAPVLARGKAHRKTGDVQIRSWRTASGPQIFFLHKEGAKANVRFVLPDQALPRELRPAAELYSEYLSGNMSALVFQEIRESRGLAYSASSVLDTGEQPRDASGLLGYLSTQAEKLPVAIETFLGLLRTADVQPSRLGESKAAVEQRYRANRIDPRWVTHWVVAWDELGEREDPRPWQREQIAKTTEEELETLAKRFGALPVIIAVVGDRERIDFAALGKIAPVREVKASELFSYGEFPKANEPKGK
jgi:predicted Zn-dependent peptidase